MLVSVADRIKRFRELSAVPAPEPQLSSSLSDSLGTLRLRQSCEGTTSYSSVDDIVSLLRVKAADRLSSADSEVRTEPIHAKVESLIDRLTRSASEEPEEIIARIRKKLQVPVEEAKLADVPPILAIARGKSLSLAGRVGNFEAYHVTRPVLTPCTSERVNMMPLEKRDFSLVKCEGLEIENSYSEPRKPLVQDMCLNPDWRRYIEREIASVRSQIKCSLLR